MNGKCAQCDKEGDMRIYDCGLSFCDFECKSIYRFRPNMTDETFEWDTIIDMIELDGGKESMTIKTVDAFYSEFSGYKVIVTQERIFWHKQLCGFPNVSSAQKAWKKLKKDKDLESWADSHSSGGKANAKD